MFPGMLCSQCPLLDVPARPITDQRGSSCPRKQGSHVPSVLDAMLGTGAHSLTQLLRHLSVLPDRNLILFTSRWNAGREAISSPQEGGYEVD